MSFNTTTYRKALDGALGPDAQMLAQEITRLYRVASELRAAVTP